jgi:outer membrane protein OmpA-like peptidoglycan-associated protein
MKVILRGLPARALLLVGLVGLAAGCATKAATNAPVGPSQTETRSADYNDLEARPPSERRAKEAFDQLLPFAAVSEEPRGVVVVLPASVLFEGASAELMETARARLDRVADALGEVANHPVVVRGHEAKSDDAQRDLELSRRRAEAVGAYLVSRGVRADRLRVDGLGRGEPVASNTTSQGRDENRRVEIVVEGAGAAAERP